MGLFYQQQDDSTRQAQDDGNFLGCFLESRVESELSNKLKSSLIGGYSKKSVEEFVTEMRSNLMQVKNQLEQQIHDITAEKANVTRECAVLREQLQTAETNMTKIQSQIVEQALLEEKLEANEQELRESRSEIQQLQSMLAQYGNLKQEQEQLKLEIQAKEQRIADLDMELVRYKERCHALEQERANFEAMPHNAQIEQDCVANREEMEHYREQLQKAEFRIKEVEQELQDEKKARREIELASQESNEGAVRLAEEQTRITEMEQDLARKEFLLQEREKFLAAEQEALEKNRADLQDLYNHLQEDMEKNRLLSAQLIEKDAAFSREMEQMQVKLSEKDRELSEVKEKMGLRADNGQDVMERVDQLFQSYTKNKERVRLLESQMSEKTALVQHYQKYEQENILLRKECEKDRKAATQLREALEKMMLEMENQAEGVQMYVTRAMQERESLQRTFSELTALKLDHVELMHSMTQLTESYETVQKEKERLETELEQLKAACRTKVFNLTNALPEKEATSEDPGLEKCSKALDRAKMLIQQFAAQEDDDMPQNA